MQYHHIEYEALKKFCVKAFQGYHFTEEESEKITDVLLDADLSGIESHGIQRLTRYHYEITSGMVHTDAKYEIVSQTPVSAVIDGKQCMGQLLGIDAMNLAIAKAKQFGFGMVTVRDGNHYGIAGHYAKMAAREGLIGISMTNTEAIMVPTFGKQPMLGTNPIAFAMPAKPCDFVFDAATTVVPRGKLEVYAKRGNGIPMGWALDETGHDNNDPDRVLTNIINKNNGGILPLGGFGEKTSGHKGYGLGLLVDICTGILSGGVTSNYINIEPNHVKTCMCFIAIDYGMFGDKAEIEAHLSQFLQELRDSEKADSEARIYTHGEKEYEKRIEVLRDGVPLNDKTYSEMKMIAEYTGTTEYLPEYID